MEICSRYHSGPLHDLQRLEDAECNNGTSSEKHKLKELEKEIQNLTNKRDELKWKLERAPAKVIQRLLIGDIEENEKDLSSADFYQEACDALTQARKHKIQETANLYRLSGISIEQVKPNGVRLTFDTFNEGNFFESYYIEIDGTSIVNHSLPYFIPVTKIAEQHLSTSLRQFSHSVMMFLSAFVARRQFIQDLQAHLLDHLKEEINSNKSYDVCCLSLINFPGLQIHLMFPLDKSSPRDIKVIKLNKKSPELTEDEQENLSRIIKLLLAAEIPDINP